MRAFLLLALVAQAVADDAGTGAQVLQDLISNLSTEITTLTNNYQETKNRTEQNIKGEQDREEAFQQQADGAAAEEEGFAAKAKKAAQDIDATQAHLDTLKADINALTRVLKVTETQTLEQVAEIDNGLSAVALAKQKVGEMGSVPASLLQTLAPKIDMDDFESLYNAKKGKSIGLLAKGGAAFTSSSDVLMNKLTELEDKMVENKKDVQADHKAYKNHRNELKATKNVEAQQAQERLDTLEADKALYQKKSNKAKGQKQAMQKQVMQRQTNIKAKQTFLKNETAEFEKEKAEKTEERKIYRDMLEGMNA